MKCPVHLEASTVKPFVPQPACLSVLLTCRLSRTQMATLEGAEALMEELRAASWDAAKADLAEVQRFAREHGEGEELRQWDVSFWAERLRCPAAGHVCQCMTQNAAGVVIASKRGLASSRTLHAEPVARDIVHLPHTLCMHAG